MRCSRCGTSPEDLWRWCPECGGQLIADRMRLVGAVVSFGVDWATPLSDVRGASPREDGSSCQGTAGQRKARRMQRRVGILGPEVAGMQGAATDRDGKGRNSRSIR